MDGDHSAKTMDSGASSALKTSDLSDGIHENVKNTSTGAGEKTTGGGTSVFSKDGAIGSAFTTQGSIGGTAQKVGGPFSDTGAIGKNFTAEGSIGGTAQKLAEKNEQH